MVNSALPRKDFLFPLGDGAGISVILLLDDEVKIQVGKESRCGRLERGQD
jgi:hypothetical protein